MVIRTILTLLILSAAGCRVEPATPATPLDERIGWVNGSCLAIMNKGLQANGPITVVALDDTPASWLATSSERRRRQVAGHGGCNLAAVALT